MLPETSDSRLERGRARPAANSHLSVVVDVIIENLHSVIYVYAESVIQENLTVLNHPIETRVRSRTAGGHWVNTPLLKRSGKFFDRQILKLDVVGTEPGKYADRRRHHAGLYLVAAWVIVKVDDVVGVVKPPLASQDGRQCGCVQMLQRHTIKEQVFRIEAA